MRRATTVCLACLAALACAEPPPPVAEDVMAQVTTEPLEVTLGSRSAFVSVASVPQGFFENTARPVLGRTFLEADFTGAPSVCIISYSLWEQFGSGESDAPLVAGAARFAVIGVMPAGFDLPLGVDVWLPR